MIEYSVRTIHNITHPDETPRPGDVVEIECVGGFVMAVDPHTQKSTERHQQFVWGTNGTMRPSHGA